MVKFRFVSFSVQVVLRVPVMYGEVQFCDISVKTSVRECHIFKRCGICVKCSTYRVRHHVECMSRIIVTL